MAQIKVKGKMQRIAVINQNRVVAKAVRYSTVKQDELTSYAAQSSNGDALVNGGSTNITAGSNYSVQIAGTGLVNLTVADFTLPAGSTIAITSQSNTLIAATISNAQEGDFKIAWGGSDIFTASLVVVAPVVTVTGYSYSENGNTISLETTHTSYMSAVAIYLVGENLDELTNSDFANSSAGVSNLQYTPATGKLECTLTSHDPQSIVIQNDGTTIATINCKWDVASGDDGD